eukprot:2820250-Pyramimonas_sp.AAC.1
MLDAVSAFYRAVRELVMQLGTSDADLHNILQTAGLPPGAIEDLEALIAAHHTLLEQAGIARHIRALTASSYSGNWFWYPGASAVAFSLEGA